MHSSVLLRQLMRVGHWFVDHGRNNEEKYQVGSTVWPEATEIVPQLRVLDAGEGSITNVVYRP
jgi:hypothetical protein